MNHIEELEKLARLEGCADLEELLMNVENRDVDQAYDDYVDECNEVVIGNLTYRASWVWKQVDPIAYNCGFSDWLDYEISEDITIEIDDKYYLVDDIDRFIEELKEKHGVE